MELQNIPIEKLFIRGFSLWEHQWLLLTSGDFQSGQYNTMTVAWGSLGAMWNKPFAQVVVRPVRYTYEFLEKYDTFTLSVFPSQYRKALSLLGARSGRDGDKIASAGLTPISASKVASPVFAEAELVIECRKIYFDDFRPENFLSADIDKNYPNKDYHRIYYGEILAVQGIEEYLK